MLEMQGSCHKFSFSEATLLSLLVYGRLFTQKWDQQTLWTMTQSFDIKFKAQLFNIQLYTKKIPIHLEYQYLMTKFIFYIFFVLIWENKRLNTRNQTKSKFQNESFWICENLIFETLLLKQKIILLRCCFAHRNCCTCQLWCNVQIEYTSHNNK